MTAEEICRNYRQAANKSAQVGILADINVTTKDRIRKILEERGITVKKSNYKGRPSKIWTQGREKKLEFFIRKGFTQGEIAKELGISRSTLYKKLSKMKNAP